MHDLRKNLDIPGMKILQFGFGNKGAHIYLPHRYERDCVVYTGTHDNDTIVGWWNNPPRTKRKSWRRPIWESEKTACIGHSFGPRCFRCQPVLIPVQDVLGLDSNARMNVPSETVEAGPGGCGPERSPRSLQKRWPPWSKSPTAISCVKQPSIPN